jgi:putative transposase
LLGEDWFDRLEAGVRQHIRSFIKAMLESELEAVLNCGRYERTGSLQGHRHGHRDRQILGTFRPTTLSVPRARLVEADSTTWEWYNQTLPTYKWLTKQAVSPIYAPKPFRDGFLKHHVPCASVHSRASAYRSPPAQQ